MDFGRSCTRMMRILRIRDELAEVVRMSGGEAIGAEYRAMVERMDALVEAEARFLAASGPSKTQAS